MQPRWADVTKLSIIYQVIKSYHTKLITELFKNKKDKRSGFGVSYYPDRSISSSCCVLLQSARFIEAIRPLTWI